MNDDDVKREVEALATRLMLGEKEKKELLAFVRRMMAAVVRSVKSEACQRAVKNRKGMGIPNTAFPLDQLAAWCEAEAKRLEGT